MARLERKHRGRWLLGLVLNALVSFGARPVLAQAEPARVALEYQTPLGADCATEQEIGAEIARLAEHRPASRKQSYRIRAVAFEHEGSWVAEVTLFDEQGRFLGGRDVHGFYRTCRELDVPLSLVVATLLDGLREPTPPPAPRGPREGKLGVGGFLAGAVGILPAPAFGAGVGVDLPLGWPVALDASAYLPREKLDGAGRGLGAWAFHAGASVCPRLVGVRHELRLCGGAQLGAVLAKGVGLTESGRDAKPLLLVGLEPKLLLGLVRGIALQLSLGAHWVALRPRFHWEIEGEGQRSAGALPFAVVARIGIIDFLR